MHDDHFSIRNTKQADSAMHAKNDGSLIAKPGNENLTNLDNPPQDRRLPCYACRFFGTRGADLTVPQEAFKARHRILKDSDYGRRKKKVD
ncbi:hypothetical protein [Nonomuraea sp. B1E8]|uniref:hypothetical protein n=1 Tax=unclassified Nonomuraea TaxID=2593643 RepID=UPI00325E5740